MPHDALMQPESLKRLVELLHEQSRPDVTEASALVLASCCRSWREVGVLGQDGRWRKAVSVQSLIA